MSRGEKKEADCENRRRLILRFDARFQASYQPFPSFSSYAETEHYCTSFFAALGRGRLIFWARKRQKLSEKAKRQVKGKARASMAKASI